MLNVYLIPTKNGLNCAGNFLKIIFTGFCCHVPAKKALPDRYIYEPTHQLTLITT